MIYILLLYRVWMLTKLIRNAMIFFSLGKCWQEYSTYQWCLLWGTWQQTADCLASVSALLYKRRNSWLRWISVSAARTRKNRHACINILLFCIFLDYVYTAQCIYCTYTYWKFKHGRYTASTATNLRQQIKSKGNCPLCCRCHFDRYLKLWKMIYSTSASESIFCPKTMPSLPRWHFSSPRDTLQFNAPPLLLSLFLPLLLLFYPFFPVIFCLLLPFPSRFPLFYSSLLSYLFPKRHRPIFPRKGGGGSNPQREAVKATDNVPPMR